MDQPETENDRHIIAVAFDAGADQSFHYTVPDSLWPVSVGQRVKVPFGKKDRLKNTFCVEADVDREQLEKARRNRKRKFKLKSVAEVIDESPLLDKQLMNLAHWISDYYVCPLGQVLSAMIPAAVKKGIGIKKEKMIYLAPDAEIENARGKKQEKIVELLQEKKAFDPKFALQLNDIVKQVGCTEAPVKSLMEKSILKMTQKRVFKSLPVVPEDMIYKTNNIALNDDQQKALGSIESKINSKEFSVVLLHGVTDSGKTEVYIRAIEKAVQNGRQAIILLPEIALTAQTVQRFSSRFENIAVMHSGLTASQRNTQWQNIKAGNADVVIGARSAVFAPVPNLGLIVVDEEHEPSYKQDTVPRYHGRDVAIKRAQMNSCLCLLGTATPSLETLHNCKTKNSFHLEKLTKRVLDLPAPQMKLVDMKNYDLREGDLDLVSKPLADQITTVLNKGEQAILLLNRRGYSNFVYCPSCKYTLTCRNCDVTLTFHKHKTKKLMPTVMGEHMNFGYAVCHHCLSQTLVPKKCPLCGKGMALIGLGSQKLEEELTVKFPEAKVKRIDSDSMSGKDYYHLLDAFSRKEIDILAGTQMLAKGLHFPNVTLVGIISADTSLYLPDFRTNERTFQMITQVAGRTGRSEKGGVVFLQTFLPEQPAIQFTLKQDFEGFVREELKHRKQCLLPPFWRMAVITLRDPIYEKLEKAANAYKERLDFIVAHNRLRVNIRGPMPAAISRIQRFHRIQIILQAPTPQVMQRLFSILRDYPSIRPAVKVVIDIDPVNLL